MNRHAKSMAEALKVLKSAKYRSYVNKVYLYGSCARGEQKYNSDVDLFVFLRSDTPKEVVHSLLSDVQPDYLLPEVELKISLTNEATSSKQFNENLKREGILLWQKS